MATSEANAPAVQIASIRSSVQRVLPYAIVWLVVGCIVAFTPLAAVWHGADYWYLENVQHLGQAIVPDRDLTIVDLGLRAKDANDLRRREIGVLDALSAAAGFGDSLAARTRPSSACEAVAAHRGPRAATSEASSLPRAIVFDIAFTAETSRREPQCVAPLVAEIAQLRRAGVEIYAAQDLESSNGGGSISGRFELDPNFTENQDERIYAQLTRSGHTLITSDPYLPGGPLFYYPKALFIPGDAANGSTASCALPIVAVGRADDVCVPIVAGGEGAMENDEQIVTVGTASAFAAAVHTYTDVARTARDAGGRYVLIGDAAIDTAAGDPRSKFEILAWAVNQSVAEVRGRPLPRVLVDDRLMLAVALAGALAALEIFLATTRILRKRAARFIVACVLAIGLPAVALVAADAILTSYGVLFSQLAFALITIVLTTAICVWAAIAAVRRDLFVTQLQQHETTVVEKYDVFISYARTAENTKWVEDNVLAPLAGVRTAEGKPLRIFFDRQTIKIGYAWYTALVEGVYGSRFFIPIYSEDYFDRPFCRDELDIAMLRQVGEDAFILPIARQSDRIPTRYARVQFLDVAKDARFIDEIVAAMGARRIDAAVP